MANKTIPPAGHLTDGQLLGAEILLFLTILLATVGFALIGFVAYWIYEDFCNGLFDQLNLDWNITVVENGQ